MHTATNTTHTSHRNPATRRRRIAGWAGGGLLLTTAAATAAAHFFGPAAGLSLRGAPFFLFDPSPRRYAAVALDAMQSIGIHGQTPEFAAARKEAEHMLDAARPRSYADTWPALDHAIAAAGGKHSKVVRPDAARTVPVDIAHSKPLVKAEEVPGGRVIVATVPGHLGDAGGPRSQAYADALAEGIARESAAGACGAIVDLRGNRGGDMGPMVAGLSALLPDGEVLWFDAPTHSTAVTVSGGSVQGGGYPITVAASPKANIPVAVLVDGNTASSGEATMLAFRGLERSRSFGTPTAGYASANMPIAMPGGATLLLTAGKDRDRTGAVHLDDPVRPDEIVTGTSGSADAHAAALAWLSTQGCG